MKPTLLLSLMACIGAVATSYATPVVQPLKLGSMVLGSLVTLQANVTDSSGNLVSATFIVSGPATRDSNNLGALNWPPAQVVGTVNISGSQATPQMTWQPPAVGSYMVWVQVADATTSATGSGPFETVPDRFTVPANTNIANGGSQMFLDNGEIVTAENDTASTVTVQSGGNLVLWSGGRVDLKPGFHAYNGAFLWATVDHDMNGYSDQEEATCTSGDGIPDAWKIDHGLAIGINYSSQPQYKAAYLASLTAGRPTNATTSNGQLVLRTPASGYVVNTQSWSISGL